MSDSIKHQYINTYELITKINTTCDAYVSYMDLNNKVLDGHGLNYLFTKLINWVGENSHDLHEFQ